MKPYTSDFTVTDSLPDLHSHHRRRMPETDTSQLRHHVQSSGFDSTFSDDAFFEQVLSTAPSCSPWELDPSTLQIPTTAASAAVVNGGNELRDFSDQTPTPPSSSSENLAYQFDESANLASKLCGYQINEMNPAAKVAMMMLQQQLLMSGAMVGVGDSGVLAAPLSLDGVDEGSSSFQCPNPIFDGSVPSLYNELPGSMHGSGSGHSQNHSQHFHHPQTQSFGIPGVVNNSPQSGSPAGPGTAGATPTQPRPRVRARRGQATDPHSIAERLRRERIAERTRALQELVPNANKTDKASMLDEIIDYVKFLQLQVKVLSMSRLGGATGSIPPLVVADKSSEGGGGCIQPNVNSGSTVRISDGSRQPSSDDDAAAVTEHRVAKLMEEDMGSAMQYLQGKGLCLMPLSLASAISSAACHRRNSTPTTASGGGNGPASPITMRDAAASISKS